MSKISPKKKMNDLNISIPTLKSSNDSNSKANKTRSKSPYGPTVKPLDEKLYHPKLDVIKAQIACSPYRISNYDRSMIEFSKILHKERFEPKHKNNSNKSINNHKKHYSTMSTVSKSPDTEFIPGTIEKDHSKIQEMKERFIKEFDEVMLFDVKYFTKYKQEPLKLPIRPASANRVLQSPINNTSKLPNIRRSSTMNTFNYFYSNRDLDNFNKRPASAVREYKWNIRI